MDICPPDPDFSALCRDRKKKEGEVEKEGERQRQGEQGKRERGGRKKGGEGGRKDEGNKVILKFNILVM